LGFVSERASKSAVIIINGEVEKIFPLFGAFEERKWAEGWNPELIYPSAEIIEEGTTFKTNAHGHGEAEFIWRVTKYEPAGFIIQYLVSTENRYWMITIKCSRAGVNKTSAEITYTYIGLNETGNKLNEHSLQRMFEHGLKDWEEAMNNYLKTIS